MPLRGPASATMPSGFRGPELSTLADDLEDASQAPSARLPLLVSQSTLGGASGLILALAAELSGAHGTPLWEPLGLGVLVGGIYATVVDICVVTRWLVPGRRLGVVVTGGSRGLGKAMAREFLLNGGGAAACPARSGLRGAMRPPPSSGWPRGPSGWSR